MRISRHAGELPQSVNDFTLVSVTAFSRLCVAGSTQTFTKASPPKSAACSNVSRARSLENSFPRGENHFQRVCAPRRSSQLGFGISANGQWLLQLPASAVRRFNARVSVKKLYTEERTARMTCATTSREKWRKKILKLIKLPHGTLRISALVAIFNAYKNIIDREE